MAFSPDSLAVEWDHYNAILIADREDQDLRQWLKRDKHAEYTCRGFAYESRTACSRLSERLVDVGCIHEHVSHQRLCAVHEEAIGQDALLCADCHGASCNCTVTRIPPR